MLFATFRETLEAPWTGVASLRVGEPSQMTGAPSAYVIVEREGEPLLRVDLYDRGGASKPFQEVAAWAELIVIGFAGHVHLVGPMRGTVKTLPLSGYFGHIYTTEEKLLIADAEQIHCFDQSGAVLWRSETVGIDGVVVHNVEDGIIAGEGEWDPPGGWRPFRLLLSSGVAPRSTQ